LTAAWPDLEVAAVTLGRGRKSRSGQLIRSATLPPLPGSARQSAALAALAALATVVDLYDRGMREPLPIYCDTSAAWAGARHAGKEPEEAARQEWSSSFDFRREDGEPEHVLVRGEGVTFEELLDEKPGEDESGSGWADDEPSRLGRLAGRLWSALLSHERLEEG
jgi:exodeoxyribonuclease V gamma subunit